MEKLRPRQWKGVSNSASAEVPEPRSYLSPYPHRPTHHLPTDAHILLYRSVSVVVVGTVLRASWSVTVAMSTKGKHRDIGKKHNPSLGTRCGFSITSLSQSSLFLTDRIHPHLPGNKPLRHPCSSVPLVFWAELASHPVVLPSALGDIGLVRALILN